MKINKKKFIKRILFLIIFISFVIYGIYLWKTPSKRDELFSYYYSIIFKFKKEEINNTENVFSIRYDPAVQTNIIAGQDGILIIDKTGMKEYINSDIAVWQKELLLKNPIVVTENKRIVIGELKGKKIIVFNTKEQLWENEIDGSIEKLCINKEGYVGVIFTQTGYKNGFSLFSPKGEKLYTKLFANTILIDADIQDNGKNVAMIESDATGTFVDSVVSCLSENGEVICSSLETDTLMNGVNFFGSDVVAVGDLRIIKFNKNNEKTILDDFAGKKVSGVNIESDRIIKVFKNTDNLFADKAIIEITDINNKKKGTGAVSGVIKSVESTGKTIAVVLNDRIDFFDISGKYLSTKLVSGDYKDVELFNDGNYACIQTLDQITVVKVR